MRVTGWMSLGLAVFFAALGTVYWYVSGYEPAGSLLLFGGAGMAAIVAAYLLVVTRHGEASAAVEVPETHASVWPFAVGGAATVAAVGVAYGMAPLLVGLMLLVVTGWALVTEHWRR